MKIFIIGWGRTGTTTVTSALRILGFNILGWNDWWFNEELSANMLDDLLHGNSFRCLSDYDGADQCVIPIYKQIDNDLPGSKFILTIRDLDEWSVSYLAHYRRITDKYPPKIDFKSYWRVAKTGSYYVGPADMPKLRMRHQSHVAEVMQYFGSRSDLLVMRPCHGDGWGMLCDFLGMPVPECAFPYVNRGGDPAG